MCTASSDSRIVLSAMRMSCPDVLLTTMPADATDRNPFR
jgi:hypothetical protein